MPFKDTHYINVLLIPCSAFSKNIKIWKMLKSVETIRSVPLYFYKIEKNQPLICPLLFPLKGLQLVNPEWRFDVIPGKQTCSVFSIILIGLMFMKVNSTQICLLPILLFYILLLLPTKRRL